MNANRSCSAAKKCAMLLQLLSEAASQFCMRPLVNADDTSASREHISGGNGCSSVKKSRPATASHPLESTDQVVMDPVVFWHGPQRTAMFRRSNRRGSATLRRQAKSQHWISTGRCDEKHDLLRSRRKLYDRRQNSRSSDRLTDRAVGTIMRSLLLRLASV